MWRDIRFAARSLAKARLFAGTVALTLGVGLGAAVAALTVMRAIYFSPLPFPHIDRVVMIETSWVPYLCNPVCPPFVSQPEFDRWRQNLPALDGIAGITDVERQLVEPSGSATVTANVVSPDFFEILGIRPALGRALVSSDDRGGAERVVVLGHRTWVHAFGGDSSIVGKQVLLVQNHYPGGRLRSDTIGYRVVGVAAPASGLGPPITPRDSLRVFIAPAAAQLTDLQFTSVVARLRPGASAAAVQSRLDAVVNPDTQMVRYAHDRGYSPDWKTRVLPLRTEYARQFASGYPVALAAILLLVLVAGANVAILFLVRWYARREEMAMRVVLGASRRRLLAHVGIEIGILWLACWVVSLVTATWAISLLQSAAGASLPYWTVPRVDAVSAFMALVLTGGCFLLFGFLPAVAVLRPSYGARLSAGRTTIGARGYGRLRSVLLFAEISAMLVLITSAGLLAKTFVHAATADIGYSTNSNLAITVANRAGAAIRWPSAQRMDLADALISRIEAVPGVRAAAIAGGPEPGLTIGSGQSMNGQAAAMGSSWSVRAVSAHYFAAYGVQTLKGRGLLDTDDAASPRVGVVDEWTAKHAFGDSSAIGRRIQVNSPASGSSWITVVGVVSTQRCVPTVTCTFSPMLYAPMRQIGLASSGTLELLVAARPSNYAAVENGIRNAVSHMSPPIIVTSIVSAESRRDMWLGPLRVRVALAGAVTGFALILALVGIYGVVAYSVAGNTREIGVRAALGATGRDIAIAVAKPMALVLVAGLVAGSLASLAATRFIRAMLYGVTPNDPTVLVLAALVLALAVAVAAFLPARAATRISPLIAMKSE